MKKNCTRPTFTGQNIYVGIDVGKKNWETSIFTERYEHKTFHQPPQVEILVNYLHREFPGATYRCAYEAGFCGFWIHDQLEEKGIDCTVVHPPDVPTSDQERKRKNNKVDTRKLARGLRSGDLVSIYVPTRDALEDRRLLRRRSDLVRKQTRCKNQIKSHLDFFGYFLPEEKLYQHWSRNFIAYLEKLPMKRASGQFAFLDLLEELKSTRQRLATVDRVIRTLAKEEPYRESVRLLTTIPGVGIVSAMLVLTELVDIDRFKNLDRLATYVGLVPGEHSTGDKATQTGLTKRRNRVLRPLLIQCSWMAVRKDPALMAAFNELSKRMKKNRAIVRIARKLLNRIRYVLKHQEPYETGVLAS